MTTTRPDRTYFRVQFGEYSAGDLIHSVWGRIVQGVGPTHGHFAREEALEASRIQIAPNAVSRLRANFATLTLDAAEHFLLSNPVNPSTVEYNWDTAEFDLIGGDGWYIYEVTAPPTANITLCDMQLVDKPDFYWQPPDRDTETAEALIDGALTVTAKVCSAREVWRRTAKIKAT